MKPPIPIAVALHLTLAAASMRGATPPHPLVPNAPRTVTVSESQTPPVIRAGLLQSTLIVLPAEEKVANVFAGYTLELREVSNDDDTHYDSKVLNQPGDKTAQDRLAQLPGFVPAADLDKAKQEAAAAQAAQAATLKAEQAKEETYRSQYPGSLHFDYAWDEKKGKELGLQQIWRDDKFTYLRGQFQETPALYEVKDKKPSLINFDFANGLYVVPKELDNGYLAIGKQRVDFHRNSEGR